MGNVQATGTCLCGNVELDETQDLTGEQVFAQASEK